MKNKPTQYLMCIIALLFITSSCKKSNNDIDGSGTGQTKLTISTAVSNYGDGDMILLGSNTNLNRPNFTIADTTIALNGDFLLQAELTSVEGNIAGNLMANNLSNAAAASTLFPKNAYYRLVVYNKKNGTYVTERLYQYGKELDASPILLDGGVEYTFIAISLHSNTKHEEFNITYENTTLANAQFIVTGHKDLLFFKKDMVISGKESDNLEIVFKHKFNQITATVDVTSTGFYLINPLNVNFNSTIERGLVNFADESVVKTGNASNVKIPFPYISGNTLTSKTNVITSDPFIFNALSGANSIAITSITINEVTQGSIANPLIITLNAPLEAGKRYNLKLTVRAADANIDNYGGFGYKAARINGLVWMRHNVGVPDYSVDPDVPSAAIHGKYYQWGKGESNILGNITDVSQPPAGWTGLSNGDAHAWNGNPSADVNIRESSPSRTTNDPCPSGYRVPTLLEMENLTDATKSDEKGPNTGGNFSSAIEFASKKTKGVKLTFAKQGYFSRDGIDGSVNFKWRPELSNRGQVANYWTSYYSGTLSRINDGVAIGQMLTYTSYTTSITIRGITVYAQPVRCIAENSNL